MRTCKHTYCIHNTAHSVGTQRYGEKCLNVGNRCTMREIAGHANVINVLDQSIDDGYQYLPWLTDAELDFCIAAETRRTGIARLKAHKKSRQRREAGEKK